MMLFHKFKQLAKAIKWHREVRQAVSTHLTLLENPSDFALGGLTPEDESHLVILVELAGRFDGPIVEFGTLFGLTTRLLATVVRKDQPVITVDNFIWNPFGLPPSVHESFARKVLRSELADGRVVLHVGDSEAFRRGYRGRVPALVFLDADHSYAAVRDEIAWAMSIGVPIIAGHDYGNPQFGVTRAVDEAFPNGITSRGAVWAWKRDP